ncbi:MAG: GGDEF domain-containing protein [Pseudomonadota bacterium]
MSEQVFGIINPVMALIFSIGALLIWRRDTRQIYIIGMAIAPFSLGVSFTLNHYFVIENALAIRMTTSFFAFVAVIALVWSACARLGKPAPLLIWITGAVVSLGLMALSEPSRDVIPWVFLVNVYCGVIFVMGALLLSEARSPEPMDRATIWVFSAIAAQFFARPVLVYMLSGPMSSDAYRDSAGHAAYIVTGSISMVLLAGVLMGSAMVDLMKALKDAARTDSLSGLVLRDAFEEGAAEMFARAKAENAPVSVIVADIDHFKRVNDLWGHPAGDKAIARLGEVFTRTIRSTDMAGRIGGEEFCVLVWRCPEDAAGRLAERLRVQFAQERHEGIEPDIRLTASFGVAAWNAGESYASVYERADEAMYRAKRSGRNRVVSSSFGLVGETHSAQTHSAEPQPAADGSAKPAQIVAIGPVQAAQREAG